jgi:hypothetical protein
LHDDERNECSEEHRRDGVWKAHVLITILNIVSIVMMSSDRPNAQYAEMRLRRPAIEAKLRHLTAAERERRR